MFSELNSTERRGGPCVRPINVPDIIKMYSLMGGHKVLPYAPAKHLQAGRGGKIRSADQGIMQSSPLQQSLRRAHVVEFSDIGRGQSAVVDAGVIDGT